MTKPNIEARAAEMKKLAFGERWTLYECEAGTFHLVYKIAMVEYFIDAITIDELITKFREENNQWLICPHGNESMYNDIITGMSKAILYSGRSMAFFTDGLIAMRIARKLITATETGITVSSGFSAESYVPVHQIQFNVNTVVSGDAVYEQLEEIRLNLRQVVRETLATYHHAYTITSGILDGLSLFKGASSGK